MAVQTPIRGLRSFCIAAKCLSFKHAASKLFLTPSAVSHQIKQLEEQLGFSLFKRQTRSIELTPAGKRFYISVEPIVTSLENTIRDFANSKQNSTITVSLPEFFASELFVPSLSEWTEQHPHINLQLDTVKSGSDPSPAADLSIVLANSKPNHPVISELFAVRYVVACNKSMYRKWVNQGYKALQAVPLILHQSRPWAWHQWADRVNIDDFDPKQIIQFDSMFGVARAAQQGMGIALVPMPISQTWFKEQSLVRLFDQELVSNDRYYLVQHENIEQSEELSLFADWVQNKFSDR
ncbi:LysR substrate-binding domain-containing protein [Thalassotalea maritima]|uniref:LysR substrate-binding domain-containing protein n=1 Tax=Thalassotalea maritima TaxID=3242416 RepID=UPI003527D402